LTGVDALAIDTALILTESMISLDDIPEKAGWQNMSYEEIRNMIEQSSKKILQISRPPVRFYILAGAEERPLDDPQVMQAWNEMRQMPQRNRLLQTLRADGTWPISRQRRQEEAAGPGPPVGWTYITMLRRLYDLREYQVTVDEGNVRAVLEKILSWQTPEGYIPGPHTDVVPYPHYNGFALRGLLGFEMQDDPRVKRLMAWILRTQRSDGGWLIPYLQDVKYLPEYKFMKIPAFMNLIREGKIPEYDPDQFTEVPSCIWSTMMVIRGLSMNFETSELDATGEAADFVLDRFFKRNYHATYYRSEDNWTRLKYPTYLGSGLLALDILTWLGYGADDERMEKPVRWLMGMRDRDMMWSQSERPHPEKDQWITAIALNILSRYAKSLKGEPFGKAAERQRLLKTNRTRPL